MTKQKKFIKKNQVSGMTIPKWPELSVRKMWAYAMEIPGFRDYMPDDFTGDHKTDRAYFWGYVVFLCEPLVVALINNTREQREAHHKAKAE